MYKSALERFPQADVYVAATADTSTRPFSFKIKQQLARLAGVPADRFVQVKSPFQAKEITSQYDADHTQLIFVRSEKDQDKPPSPGGRKKDGTLAYLQPLDSKVLPMSQHGYMAYLPTVEFASGMTSATEIRSRWPAMDAEEKTRLVQQLYPGTAKNAKLTDVIVKMFDEVIGSSITEDMLDEGIKEKLVAAGMAGIMALTALAPTAAQAEVQKEPTKAMKVVKQTDMGNGIKRVDFKDGSHSIQDASGITVYDAAGKAVQKVSPRVGGYQQSMGTDGSTTQTLDRTDSDGLGMKVSQTGGKTSASMNIAGQNISNEATLINDPDAGHQIRPDGGMGTWDEASLVSNLARKFSDMGRMLEAGRYQNLYYVIYESGVLHNMLQALDQYQRFMQRQGRRPLARGREVEMGENQGWAATLEQDGQMAGTPAAGMQASYQRRENQPVDEDYIEEKWSEKYRRSIDCDSPRGFSQRAHCAGRKK